MELIAAYLACVLLGLTGLRLGIPEAYHTLADRRHEARLRRTEALEIELGLREPTRPQISQDAYVRALRESDIRPEWYSL